MNERMSGPVTTVKMTSGENWPATVWTRGELNQSGQEIWPGNGTGTDGGQERKDMAAPTTGTAGGGMGQPGVEQEESQEAGL